MSDKNWGIMLIITSVFMIAAISFLLYTILTPAAAVSTTYIARGLAIFACILQFIVFIMFSRTLKKKK
ncbi:MAG: hypothetical protein ACOYJB_04705 [Christensenellaceae bacterium]